MCRRRSRRFGNMRRRFGNALELIAGDETQGFRVQAIAEAGGARSVFKHVPQVCAATLAENLGADHTVATICFLADIFLRHRSEEAWPTRAGLEFRRRLKQRQIAADADEHAGPFFVQQTAAKGRFGIFSAGDVVLLGRQTFPPFGLGENQRGHLSWFAKSAIGADGSNTNVWHGSAPFGL